MDNKADKTSLFERAHTLKEEDHDYMCNMMW